MTLTEFLLARITEDKATALKTDPFSQSTWYAERRDVLGRQLLQGVGEDHSEFDEDVDVFTAATRDHAAHIVRFSPARVLAECEAKRRIVDELDLRECGPCARAERCITHDLSAGGLARDRLHDEISENILRALALPYTDHPDYDEAWRP